MTGQAYTLRQLLAHTTGLPDYGQFPEYGKAVSAGEVPWSRQKMLDVGLSKGMLFEPEQGWSYSNIGYMFAREILEAASGRGLGEIVNELVCEPLGLVSVELAETQKQFAQLHWRAAANYDPKWVYHGCLIGTARDAAKLLHALFSGELLSQGSLKLMLETRWLDDITPRQPWARCGYALGLMAGGVDGLGRSIGHSGGGPFSTNAVYHFPDLPAPMTVACFTQGIDEGIAEVEAVRHVQAILYQQSR